ncbi:MAG: CoA pyrophosphatase, partial [Candidatus Bathyarchaeia archaeon]
YSESLEQRIRRILMNRERSRVEPRNLVRAAVLVPLLRRSDEYCLLFTRRPKELRSHPGQISFPGGLFEEADINLRGTVIREAKEEIGLSEADIEFLGELDDYASTTGYLITPFVAKIPYPYGFKVNKEEISELILARVEEFKKPPRVGYVIRDGKPYPVYHYDLPNHVIWGATARIVKNFVDAVFSEIP